MSEAREEQIMDPKVDKKFELHPVRAGVRQPAAGSDTLVVGSANPAACHGREREGRWPTCRCPCSRERATCALNSAVAPTPSFHDFR
jgi:hypothetical protein